MFPTSDNTRQQTFGTWKVYCVCNVTFHAEFKYEITIFPSPTDLYNDILIINFSEFSSVIFLYVNQYFKWFWI